MLFPSVAVETWARLGKRAEKIAKGVENRISVPTDFQIRHTFRVTSQSSPAQVRADNAAP